MKFAQLINTVRHNHNLLEYIQTADEIQLLKFYGIIVETELFKPSIDYCDIVVDFYSRNGGSAHSYREQDK